jgi:hypothetical protein
MLSERGFALTYLREIGGCSEALRSRIVPEQLAVVVFMKEWLMLVNFMVENISTRDQRSQSAVAAALQIQNTSHAGQSLMQQ